MGCWQVILDVAIAFLDSTVVNVASPTIGRDPLTTTVLAAAPERLTGTASVRLRPT